MVGFVSSFVAFASGFVGLCRVCAFLSFLGLASGSVRFCMIGIWPDYQVMADVIALGYVGGSCVKLPHRCTIRVD